MLYALCSAHGSPGVSTTALALALTWPRDAILVEADTVGYSPTLAGYFAGRIAPTATLIDFLPGPDLEEQLLHQSIPLTGEQDRIRRVIPGLLNPLQGRALATRWDMLGFAFRELDRAGIDVIADLGRLHAPYCATALLHSADLSMLLLRPTIPSVMAVRAALAHRTDTADQDTTIPSLHLVAVDAPGTYSARETRATIKRPLLGTVPWSPKTAMHLSSGSPRPRNFESSRHLKSIHRLASLAYKTATTRRTLLAGEIS